MTPEMIYKVVRDIMVDLINDPAYPIIKAKQNSPEPNIPYATIFVGTFKTISGWEKKTVSHPYDIDFSDHERQRVTITVNFYKAKSQEYAEKIKLGLRRPNSTWHFQENEIGLTDTSDVRNFTAVVGNGFEYRGHMDINLNFVQTDDYTIERILSVQGDGTIEVGDRISPVSFDTRLINP